MRPFLLLLFLSAAVLPAAGQGKARNDVPSKFDVRVDPAEIALGETVEITYTVDQAEGSSFTPPDWAAAGLTIVSTSQSSNMSVSGGKVRSSHVFRYTVLPTESGTLVVPPARLKTGAGELETTAVELRVKPAPDGSRTLTPRNDRRKRAEPKLDLPTIRI
jgi:hypothetical protein